MTENQRKKWDAMQYQANLEARRGHNFPYWSDDKHDKLLQSGWQFYQFPTERKGRISESISTHSELSAVETKKQLIADGYLARIFCGYDKNIQRIKTFSILFKSK